MGAEVSNYPGVTKEELEKDVVPVVQKWLEESFGHRFARGHDENGHCVYAFGATAENDAYVVYEGNTWVLDFIEEKDGGISCGDRLYEIEAFTSYEMNVVILDDYR